MVGSKTRPAWKKAQVLDLAYTVLFFNLLQLFSVIFHNVGHGKFSHPFYSILKMKIFKYVSKRLRDCKSRLPNRIKCYLIAASLNGFERIFEFNTHTHMRSCDLGIYNAIFCLNHETFFYLVF